MKLDRVSQLNLQHHCAGQCTLTYKGKERECHDGSSEIKPPSKKKEDGGCGEKLKCTARGGHLGKWKGLEVCIEEQYKCDGVLHCEAKEDEAGCNLEATERCEGKDWREDNCTKSYTLPDGDCGEDELKCTARSGRWAGEKICVGRRFRCDNHPQCLDAEDEHDCLQEYVNRGIFTTSEKHLCRSPYLEIKNKTAKFFPSRGIRCSPVSQHHL